MDSGDRPRPDGGESPRLQDDHDDRRPGLLDLPEEVRRQIFQELLVSDASYRLGHHNLFSLGPHKKIHSSILATCRLLYQEGSPVLYGENSFHLGSIGFKPIYTASLDHCIGKRNAALIRRVSFHANHSWQLDKRRITKALCALGIDLADLRVLVFSFNPCLEPIKLASHVSLGHPLTPQPTHYYPYNPIFPSTSTGALNLAGNHGPLNFQWHYLPHFLTPPHPQPASLLTGSTPLTPLPSNTLPTTLAGAPLSSIDPPPDRLTPRHHLGPILRSYATVALTHRAWLEPLPRSLVQRMVFLNGTDLRATEGWLVMRQPGAPAASRFRSEFRGVPGEPATRPSPLLRGSSGEERWMLEERAFLERLVAVWEAMEADAKCAEMKDALKRASREVLLEMKLSGDDAGLEMEWRASSGSRAAAAQGAGKSGGGDAADVEMTDVTLSIDAAVGVELENAILGNVSVGAPVGAPAVLFPDASAGRDFGRRIID